MGEGEVLVGEGAAVDGAAAGAVVVGEVAALALREEGGRARGKGLGSESGLLTATGWGRTMNWGMTRWKRLPLYPLPSSARHSCLKFSAVLGVTSSLSSITMRPSLVASP